LLITAGCLSGLVLLPSLGHHSVHVPFIGDVVLLASIIPLFTFVVVATGNVVNISDGSPLGWSGLRPSLWLFRYYCAGCKGAIGIVIFLFHPWSAGR